MAAKGNIFARWSARRKAERERRHLLDQQVRYEQDRRTVNNELEDHKERISALERGILRLEEESKGEQGDRQQVVLRQLKERLVELGQLRQQHELLVKREHSVSLALHQIEVALTRFKPGMNREELDAISDEVARTLAEVSRIETSIEVMERQEVEVAEALKLDDVLSEAARARGEAVPGAVIGLTPQEQAVLDALRRPAPTASQAQTPS